MRTDRCEVCQVPLAIGEARAMVISRAVPRVYCEGCWPDIQAAIDTQADLMMRSLM